MYENLKNEKIIVELKILLDKAEQIEESEDEDLDGYCTFMKEVILSTSGLN